MKLATCSLEDRSFVAVATDDGRVVDLAAADAELARKEERAPHAFFRDMIGFLEHGSQAREAADKAVREGLDGSAVHPLSGVRLRAPVPMPRKLFCLAGNFQDHIEEGGGKMDSQDKETPRFFMKPASTCVIGHGDSIRIPPVARAMDWEGELAVVLGRRCKSVSRDQALDYVAGYTIMNDVSERKLKIWPRSEDRPQDRWFDWLNGKWLDSAAPMGPWIVTTDEIRDPQTLMISTYVNGDRKQHNSTSQMLISVAALIEYISAIVMLEPGDVISTGTVSGVGNVTGEYLKPGDRVEVDISRIGLLSNPVAASSS
ncbi:MAG: fumarylacetoacetate hydrolase family protein [Candidatus Aminicenantes bacterium]|nr:fumarylacetoacetate hydrolase family protein [Candidatus Aminicenantes bacterium]